MGTIQISPQFASVLNFVNQTNQLIFLTGKAGTGKTTLLKYVRENTWKQVAVVAPTGVAAINAGGSTIHSFFQFPFTPFLPAVKDSGEIDFSKSNLPSLKYTSQRVNIFRNLELLVIDEISMLRADLLDQVDITLRQVRRKWHLPFGGVQVLLIGDMYQLSPVVQREEWQLLNGCYKNPYFFESLVFKNARFVHIELEKIYRQSGSEFISLLNKVRNNQLGQADLDLLNSRFRSNLTVKDYGENITLTTHNRKADDINERNLRELPGKAFQFACRVEGNFPEKNFPAEKVLVLKKGTRVMFLKNNTEKNYYNGKIGVVSFADKDTVRVFCEEDKGEIEVSKETWTNISYSVAEDSKHIEEEVLGTFTQYPLRLAWAITIHKSQGLTFDRLIIDAAESFSAGQVYVALSRCRTLDGLILSSRLSSKSLYNDPSILNFSSGKHNEEQVQTIFSEAQKEYVRMVLQGLFDFTGMWQQRGDLAGLRQMYDAKLTEEGKKWFTAFFAELEQVYDVSLKFGHQLSLLLENPDLRAGSQLQERISRAARYFDDLLDKAVKDTTECPVTTESKEAAGELNVCLQDLSDALFLKRHLMRACLNGYDPPQFAESKLNVRYPEKKISVYANSRNTRVSADIRHPALYRKLLLLRDEICSDEHKPVYMVASSKAITELASYLPFSESDLLLISGFGEARVESWGQRFLGVIREYAAEHGLSSNMQEKPVAKKKKKTKEKKQEGEEPWNDNLSRKPSTKEQSYRLFVAGFSVQEIAVERKMAVSTIEGHLVPFVANGLISIDKLVSPPKQEIISRALENYNYSDGLGSLKNRLPDDITYSELRYMIAGRIGEAEPVDDKK